MVKFIQKHIGCEEALDLPPPSCTQKSILLVAAAALVDADGRVLLAQRPEGKSLAGLWEFPGGKIDPGETPEFALMRELREELNVETRPCCFSPIGFASHSYEDFHLLMPLFICRVWRGPAVPQEGQNLKWVYPQDMFDMPMPEADIPLISQLQSAM
jgi:8-oxo-dGTP diphosphatase